MPKLGTITDENIRTLVNKWCEGHETNIIETYGHISNWDTKLVTDMSELFAGKTRFNEDLSGWDMSSVKSARRMFFNAWSLNKPLPKITKTTVDMEEFLYGAILFNQPIEMDLNKSCNLKNVFLCTFSCDKTLKMNIEPHDYAYSKIKVN